MANKPSKDEASELGFEAALEQLEGIVHRLEEGEIGLNEALEQYEKGVKLLRQCYDLLEKAERRIELLSGVDAEGKPVTTPMKDPSPSLDENAPGRRPAPSGPHEPLDRGRSNARQSDVDASGNLS